MIGGIPCEYVTSAISNRPPSPKVAGVQCLALLGDALICSDVQVDLDSRLEATL